MANPNWVSDAKPPSGKRVEEAMPETTPTWHSKLVQAAGDDFERSISVVMERAIREAKNDLLETLVISLQSLIDSIEGSYNRPTTLVAGVNGDDLAVLNRTALAARLNGVQCAIQVIQDAVQAMNPPMPRDVPMLADARLGKH